VFDTGFADLQMRMVLISVSSRDVFERQISLLTMHKDSHFECKVQDGTSSTCIPCPLNRTPSLEEYGCAS
jgi:hypothetical protein